jgi:Uncharacterized protein conserved in bacteria
MSNNFLISLRNDDPVGSGNPGTKMGNTAYFELSPDAPSYNLGSQIDKKKWLSRIAGTSVLIFVHGFGNDASKVVARHNAVKPYIPPGFTLVSFDWPSGNTGFSAYKDDKANAKQSAPRLITDCIQHLLTRFGWGNVNLFAHSMGAYVTENAFSTAGAVKINHVLMAAADVDRLNYVAGSYPLGGFLAKCNDLTAYWSSDDQALQESAKMPINNGAIPLGLSGYPQPGVPGKCRGIECTAYYRNYALGTSQIAPGPEFSHVWYLLYQPPGPAVNDFFADMAEVIRLPGLTRAPTKDPFGFLLQRPADA